MRTALRVFVIILLFLAAGALVLGVLLFNKRELVKGRTQRLERFVQEVSRTIEGRDAERPQGVDDPERDTSPVEDALLDLPERNTFWSAYKYELELAPQENERWLDQSGWEGQIKQYFKIGDDLKIVRREDGTKETTGEGTMDALLRSVVDAAGKQLDRLERTRAELSKLRKEYIDTVVALNTSKGEGRKYRVDIVNLKREKADLEAQVAERDRKIAGLEEEVRTLQDNVRERDRKIADLESTIKNQLAIIARQKEEIKKLRETPVGITRTGDDADVILIQPGDKGTVLRVNQEWNLVILKLSDECVTELVGSDRSRQPRVDMYLKRPGPDGAFVSKVRITQVKVDQNLAVADVNPEWLQQPVQAGDVLFY